MVFDGFLHDFTHILHVLKEGSQWPVSSDLSQRGLTIGPLQAEIHGEVLRRLNGSVNGRLVSVEWF